MVTEVTTNFATQLWAAKAAGAVMKFFEEAAFYSGLWIESNPEYLTGLQALNKGPLLQALTDYIADSNGSEVIIDIAFILPFAKTCGLEDLFLKMPFSDMAAHVQLFVEPILYGVAGPRYSTAPSKGRIPHER